MIDLRALRENPEPFRASQIARGADVSLVDRILEADERRRSSLSAFETARAQQKEVSRSVGKAAAEERPAILAHAKELAAQVKELEARSNEAAVELDTLAHQFQNLIEGALPAVKRTTWCCATRALPCVTLLLKALSPLTTWL